MAAELLTALAAPTLRPPAIIATRYLRGGPLARITPLQRRQRGRKYARTLSEESAANAREAAIVIARHDVRYRAVVK